MKIIERIKNIRNIKSIRNIKNINELARKAQKKIVILVLIFIGALVLVGWAFMPAKSSKGIIDINNAEKQAVKLDGITDSQFSKESSQKALEEQQREIVELHGQLKNVGEQMEVLKKALDELRMNDINNSLEVAHDMQTRIDGIENILSRKYGNLSGTDSSNKNSLLGKAAVAREITTISFSYEETIDALSKAKTAKEYVPPGTFAKAVLLNGADTNAGVNGQTDTTPITMRILDDGTLPNGKKSSLKGCFVTAAAYGDASSERGQVRLQRLSCVRKPSGQILDVLVEGTINDMGGSDGIRGHVIMRNHKLIWNAGISGILSGFGSAMQKTLTTQSVSPLGVTNAIKSGKSALQYGAFGGANTALGKLADYYIKLADMYHPIVQVNAGSEVNVVFLKGFSLTEGLVITNSNSATGKTEKMTKIESTNRNIISPDEVNQNLMQTIRDARLGQEVNFDGDSGDRI